MAVDPSDIKWFLSGGASNTDPNQSLGGEISTTEIVNAGMENLFDNIAFEEASAGETNYRCLFIQNTHLTDTLNDVAIWIHSNTPSASTSISIAVDPIGVFDPSGSPNAVEVIPDENTAPIGIDFDMSPQPDISADALPIGDLDPNHAVAIWVRRVVLPGVSPTPDDPFALRIKGVPL